MSISYAHRVLATGTEEAIANYKDNFKEFLHDAMIKTQYQYAVDNDYLDLVSYDPETKQTTIEILDPGFPTKEDYEEKYRDIDFAEEILFDRIKMLKSTPTSYSFTLGINRWWFSDEVYLLSIMFPDILFQHKQSSSVQDGYIIKTIKNGIRLDSVTCCIDPYANRAKDPVVFLEIYYPKDITNKSLSIRITGIDGEVISDY